MITVPDIAGLLECYHARTDPSFLHAKGQLSSGVVEGFNSKVKLTPGKSFGFRTFHGAEIALYHALGALLEPDLTHRFC
jgi:transposase